MFVTIEAAAVLLILVQFIKWTTTINLRKLTNWSDVLGIPFGRRGIEFGLELHKGLRLVPDLILQCSAVRTLPIQVNLCAEENGVRSRNLSSETFNLLTAVAIIKSQDATCIAPYNIIFIYIIPIVVSWSV